MTHCPFCGRSLYAKPPCPDWHYWSGWEWQGWPWVLPVLALLALVIARELGK